MTGFFAPKNLAIIGLVAVVVGLVSGVIPNPFQPHGTGITMYVLDKDMNVIKTVETGQPLYFLRNPLGVVTWNGQTIGGLRWKLWVTASGGSTGQVSVSYIGYKEIPGTAFTGGGARYCSGAQYVPWNLKSEITESTVQATWATFTFLGNGTYVVNVSYDVTAEGTIDGLMQTAKANPKTSVTMTYSGETLTIVANMEQTTLNFVK